LDGSRTTRKNFEIKIECSRPTGNSKDWWTDTVIADVKKMLETAGGKNFP
jgi:hypothetical protein